MSAQKQLETRPYLRNDVCALGYSRTRLCQILNDLAWINDVAADFRFALDHVTSAEDRRRGEEILIALSGDDPYVKTVPPARLQYIIWALQQSAMLSDAALRGILTPAKNRLEDYLWENDINPTHGAQIGEGGDVSVLYEEQARIFLATVRGGGKGSRMTAIARVRKENSAGDTEGIGSRRPSVTRLLPT